MGKRWGGGEAGRPVKRKKEPGPADAGNPGFSVLDFFLFSAVGSDLRAILSTDFPLALQKI